MEKLEPKRVDDLANLEVQAARAAVLACVLDGGGTRGTLRTLLADGGYGDGTIRETGGVEAANVGVEHGIGAIHVDDRARFHWDTFFPFRCTHYNMAGEKMQ